MTSWRVPLVGAALLLAGCSDSSGEPLATPSDVSTTTIATDDASGNGAISTSTIPLEQTEPSTSSEQAETSPSVEAAAAPPPLEPSAGPASTSVDDDATTAWISRRSMNASEIELVWSAPEGADTYEIHRLVRTEETPPPTQALAEENRIHDGPENGTFVDQGVIDGTAYWYGIRGLDAAGNVVSVGWHQAAAVTDEQPPSPVALTLEETEQSIMLSWNQPEENFELHGYRILRSVDDQEPEILATTWNIDQTTFVDDSAPSGTVTYLVAAFDFHWNESERSEVSIDIS